MFFAKRVQVVVLARDEVIDADIFRALAAQVFAGFVNVFRLVGGRYRQWAAYGAAVLR
jgi:hypothetical protein